jgi:hypothetical protein
MRMLRPVQVFSAAAAMALLAACSNGSAIAPKLSSPQSIAYSSTGRVPSLLGPGGLLDTAHHFENFYACPVKGAIEYLDDSINGVIDVYAGPFAGQAPCAQFGHDVHQDPQGIFVDPATHDLYVTNPFYSMVTVFHRGQTGPYNSYIDPGNQVVEDVAVAKDGTVITSNGDNSRETEFGSLST